MYIRGLILPALMLAPLSAGANTLNCQIVAMKSGQSRFLNLSFHLPVSTEPSETWTKLSFTDTKSVKHSFQGHAELLDVDGQSYVSVALENESGDFKVATVGAPSLQRVAFNTPQNGVAMLCNSL